MASYMCAMAKAVWLELLRQRNRCAYHCSVSGILPVIAHLPNVIVIQPCQRMSES